jgi:hypothetical protein
VLAELRDLAVDPTVRGSLSMAVARVSGVQRSSVSTESAIDHPA